MGRLPNYDDGYQFEASWPVIQTLGWRFLEASYEPFYIYFGKKQGAALIVPQDLHLKWIAEGQFHVSRHITAYEGSEDNQAFKDITKRFTFDTIETIVRPLYQDQLIPLVPHAPVDIPEHWHIQPGEICNKPLLVIDTDDHALARFFGSTNIRQLAHATAVYLLVSHRLETILSRAGFQSYYSFIARAAHGHQNNNPHKETGT